MGRDGRTPRGGMGAQGMEGAQAWGRCTVEGFGQCERDQRQSRLQKGESSALKTKWDKNQTSSPSQQSQGSTWPWALSWS